MSVSLKKKNVHKCEFCSKELTSLKRLTNHLCTYKERYLLKDTETFQLALHGFNFFESKGYGKVATNETFIKIREYKTFFDLATSIESTYIHNKPKYIEWVIGNVNPKQWCKRETFQLWLNWLDISETPDQAIFRSLEYIQIWCNETNVEFGDINTILKPGRLNQWFLSGLISPWFLFISNFAQQLSAQWSDEQWNLINTRIDPIVWLARKSKYLQEVDSLIGILEKNGL